MLADKSAVSCQAYSVLEAVYLGQAAPRYVLHCLLYICTGLCQSGKHRYIYLIHGSWSSFVDCPLYRINGSKKERYTCKENSSRSTTLRENWEIIPLRKELI